MRSIADVSGTCLLLAGCCLALLARGTAHMHSGGQNMSHGGNMSRPMNMSHPMNMTHPMNGSHGGGHEGNDHGKMSHGSSSHGGGHGEYFFLGEKTTFLFEQWKTADWGEMLGSCLAVGAAAFLYEGFKVLREVLIVKAKKHKSTKDRCLLCDCSHILQMFLHMIQLGLSYMLMLVFMTFNAWPCIALCVGGGLGYFIFRSRTCDDKRNSYKETEDHCN